MPSLVAFYDIQPGNGEGLFLFWHFINLSPTYLDTHLLTASDPHGAVPSVTTHAARCHPHSTKPFTTFNGSTKCKPLDIIDADVITGQTTKYYARYW